MKPISRPMAVVANFATIAIAFAFGLVAARLLRVPPPPESTIAVPDRVSRSPEKDSSHALAPSTAEEALIFIETYDDDRIEVGNRWRMESALYRLPVEQLPTVFEAIKAGTSGRDTEVLLALFSRWAEVDPRSAIEAAASLIDLQKRDWMVHQILRLWVAEDPDTAFANAIEVAPGMDQGRIYESLWQGLAEYEPETALARASAIEDTNERLTRSNEALRFYAYSEPENALEWVWTNRSGDAQPEAVTIVIDSWSSAYPTAAMDAILKLPARFQTREAFRQIGASIGHIQLSTSDTALKIWERTPSEFRDVLLVATVNGYAHYDPEAAVELASHLQEVHSQTIAYKEITSKWARKDPVSTSEWLAGLPEGRLRDQAVDVFAKTLTTSDPVHAAEWALSIGSNRQRESRVTAVVQSWLKTDNEAARRWIEEALLTPEERQNLAQTAK